MTISHLFLSFKVHCLLPFVSKTIFVVVIILNFVLIKNFRELEAKHSVWWAPILLEDIILHFYGFALSIVEYTSFDNKKAAW